MARKYHVKHPDRRRSAYSRRRKGEVADRYGQFREGRRQTPDKIAGRQVS